MLDENNNAYLADLSEANFNNCIIFGNDNIEILMDEIQDNAVDFNFKFTNCLIRFDSGSTNLGPNYNFSNAEHYENNIFNQQPDFKAPYENDMIIGDDSNANGIGNSIYASQVPNDILGVNRTSSPDLGAYQHITFE